MTDRQQQRPSRCAGFTLIETLIGMTLLTIVLGGVVMATQRGLGLFEQSNATADINSRAARAVNRILQEMIGSGPLVPAPPVFWGSATADFQLATGWAAGEATWGPTRRIGFEYQAGELDNGIDDNGNGLVDEGSVVLTEDVGGLEERRVVLVNGVSELLQGEFANGADDNGNGLRDEAGLSFAMEDDTLVVRLSLERIGPDGNLMVRTQTVSMRLRNGG